MEQSSKNDSDLAGFSLYQIFDVVTELTENNRLDHYDPDAVIFKLFQRLHKDDKYDGLGVGLATCQRITELHSGTISLDENYTDGTRFIVKLPNKR